MGTTLNSKTKSPEKSSGDSAEKRTNMGTLSESSSFVNPPSFTFSEFNPYHFPLFPATKGSRHDQMVKFAGHLRYHGAEETELKQQLTEADSRYHAPRKTPMEINRLAHDASTRWAPGYFEKQESCDIAGRALGWLREHCFDQFFANKRGHIDFAVLYVLIMFANRARCADFRASCRDVSLAAGITWKTASLSLRRLYHAGFIKKIGHRKMNEAQIYSLSSLLCIHQEIPWVELTSAMFRVSRAASKLELLYGNTWAKHSLDTLTTRTLTESVALRVVSVKIGNAKRILRRKGLNLLEEAEDGEWWVKMREQIRREREIYAQFILRVRLAKRWSRGEEGKLVMKRAA